jgi:hypothetical protein
MPREASARAKKPANRDPTSLASRIQGPDVIDPGLLPTPMASDSHAPDSQASDSRVLTSHPCDTLDSQPLDALNKWTFEIEEVMLNELVHPVVDLGKRADSGFKFLYFQGANHVRC